MISKNWNAQTNNPLIVFFILGIIFALLGGVFTAIDGARLIQVRGMQQHWQQTQGVIDRVQVQQYQKRHGVVYEPDLLYHYAVAGREYQNNLLQPSGFNYGTSNYRSVQQSLRPYQLGQAATVHYDPTNPSNSALNLSVKPSLFLWIGLLFLLPGIGFLITGAVWKLRLKNQDNQGVVTP